jgi:hypothetical protein
VADLTSKIVTVEEVPQRTWEFGAERAGHDSKLYTPG